MKRSVHCLIIRIWSYVDRQGAYLKIASRNSRSCTPIEKDVTTHKFKFNRRELQSIIKYIYILYIYIYIYIHIHTYEVKENVYAIKGFSAFSAESNLRTDFYRFSIFLSILSGNCFKRKKIFVIFLQYTPRSNNFHGSPSGLQLSSTKLKDFL